MTRQKATTAHDVEPAACLLCGGQTPTFADPDVEDGLAAFDLCGRCNRAFMDLAAQVAAARPAARTHNLLSVWCRTPEAVGEFPVTGEVCQLCQGEDQATAAMQAALDAAEARGQAEVVAKVEALAEELGGWGDTAPSQQQVWLADRLRALSSASPAELERRA